MVITPSSVLAISASLSLDPASGTLNKGCTYPIKVVVDTGGAQTDGTDAIIFYDASKFTITSQNIVSDTSTYADFPGNNVDEAGGKITISGLASVTTPFSGKGTLATMTFKVKDNAGAGATQMKFDFDPNFKDKTTDSNIVERATIADVLNSVVNGSYTIGTGACTSLANNSTTPSPGSGTKKQIGGPNDPDATLSGILSPTSKPVSTSIKPPCTDPSCGTPELTATMVILGGVLTVLGILGIALL